LFSGSDAARRSTRTLDGILVQRYFYASASDLLAVAATVEATRQVQYTAAVVSEDAQPQSVTAVAALPTLLAPAPGDSASTCHSYLVTLRGTDPIPRRIADARYAFDQLHNPDSIELTPSAWHSPEVLLHGRIATASSSEISRELYGIFDGAIRKHFCKVNAFWVGPEAEAAWRRGVRLTIGASSPREYDLRDGVTNAV
jgi:hypothetical protein